MCFQSAKDLKVVKEILPLITATHEIACWLLHARNGCLSCYKTQEAPEMFLQTSFKVPSNKSPRWAATSLPLNASPPITVLSPYPLNSLTFSCTCF